MPKFCSNGLRPWPLGGVKPKRAKGFEANSIRIRKKASVVIRTAVT